MTADLARDERVRQSFERESRPASIDYPGLGGTA